MSTLPQMEFGLPEALFLLGLLPVFWLWQRRAFRSLSSALLLLFHSLLLALLFVSAADLRVVEKGKPASPLLLVDVSNSLTAGQRDWMHKTIIQNLHPTADAPTLLFAGDRRRLSWGEAEALLATPPPDTQPAETNLEGLLATLLTEEANRNLFLFTDGWETKGEARSVLPLLAEKGLKIYPFAPPQGRGSSQRIHPTPLCAAACHGRRDGPGECFFREHQSPSGAGEVDAAPGRESPPP